MCYGATVDKARRTIIDRANRMLRQSKTLRKLSDELLEESKTIRVSAMAVQPKRRQAGRRAD
jgi:hypothetical protein